MSIRYLSIDYFRNILEFVDLFDNVSFQLTCKYFHQISKECISLHIACCKAFAMKLSNEEYSTLPNSIKSDRTLNKNLLLMDPTKISLILDHSHLFTNEEIIYYSHYAIVSDYFKESDRYNIIQIPKMNKSKVEKLDPRLTNSTIYEKLQTLYDSSLLNFLNPRELLEISKSNEFVKMWFYSMPSFTISSSLKEVDFQHIDEDDKKNEMFISFLIRKRGYSFEKESIFVNSGRIIARRFLPNNINLIGKFRESISCDLLVVEQLLSKSRMNFLRLPQTSWQDWRIIKLLVKNCPRYVDFRFILDESIKNSANIDKLLTELVQQDPSFIQSLLSKNYSEYLTLLRYSPPNDASLLKFALQFQSNHKASGFILFTIENLNEEIYLFEDKELLMLLLNFCLPKKVHTSKFFNHVEVLIRILRHPKSIELLGYISKENLTNYRICKAIFELDYSKFPELSNIIGDDVNICLKACQLNQDWISLISDRLKQDESFQNQLNLKDAKPQQQFTTNFIRNESSKNH